MCDQIGFDQPANGGQVELEQGSAVAQSDVVHQHIPATRLVLHMRERRRGVCLAGNVENQRLSLSAFGPDRGNGRIDRRTRLPRPEHRSAPAGGLVAQASAAAGDQDLFSGQVENGTGHATAPILAIANSGKARRLPQSSALGIYCLLSTHNRQCPVGVDPSEAAA